MDQQQLKPVSSARTPIKSRLYQNVFVGAEDVAAAHPVEEATSLSVAVPQLSGKTDSNPNIGKSVFIRDPNENDEEGKSSGKKQVKIQDKPKTTATSTVITRRNTAAPLVKKKADVEFFKSVQSGSGYAFYYLKPARSSSDPLYDPYDLEIVDYESLDPSNYYTVSKEAVLHFFKGNSECSTVEQILSNIDFAKKLREIPLISKYQKFKAFKTWIHHVRRQRNGAAANYLKKNLCHLDPILRKALLDAKEQCLGFENNISVISYPTQVTEFPQFVESQNHNINDTVIGYLQPFNDAVLKILRTCFTDSIKKQSDIFEKEVEATGVKIYRYTKQAAIRNTAKELVRFTKVVDYMVLSTINWWIIDGLSAFIKTVDACSEEKNLFKIDAIIHNDSLQLKPSQTEILGFIDSIFQLVPNCLKALDFHSNTCVSLIEAEILESNTDPSQQVDLADILFNNIQWKENLHNAQLVLEKQLFEVHKYLDSMKHFQDVYRFNSAFNMSWVNIKPDASMDSVEAWIRDCEQHLAKSQKEITEITSIPSNWQFKSFKVDLEPLKVTLLPMSTHNLDQIRTAFPIALHSRCESQMKSITVLIDSLQKTPVAISDYVARLSNLEDSQNLTENYDRSTALIDQGISLARNNGCQLPSELITLSQNFSNAIYQLKDAIDLAYQSKEHICHQFALDLDKAVQHLQTQAVHCRNEAMNPRIFNLNSNPNDNLTMLERLSKSINELSNLSTQYESYIKRFELNTTKKASLESIKTDIETKKELWTVFVSWKQQEKAWRQQSYSSVDIDSLKSILDGFVERVKKIAEILPSNDVVSDLQNSMNHLLKLYPILKDLANPDMKQKHSDKLQSQIGKLAVLKDRELPFAKLVDSTLIKFGDAVREVSAQATEEARLERLINEIATRWNDQERMPLITHQNHADLFVVGDTKTLESLLAKDRETIISMGPSPYREHVAEDLEQWSAFIEKADQLLKMCSDFQGIWNHLEHHFSVASARKELPDEARLFTRLDRSWRDIVRKMAKDPVIPRLVQNQDMVDKIKELQDTGRECHKKVVSGAGRRQSINS